MMTFLCKIWTLMQLGEYKYFLGCDSFPFLLNKHCVASL